MPNRHIKTINGRKYYYESIRMGKKVTSRYLGPVEPAVVAKPSAELEELLAQAAQPVEQSATPSEPPKKEKEEDDFYIG